MKKLQRLQQQLMLNMWSLPRVSLFPPWEPPPFHDVLQAKGQSYLKNTNEKLILKPCGALDWRVRFGGGLEQFKWIKYLTECYLLAIIMHINDTLWIFNTFFFPECPVLQSYHGAIPKSCWWSVVSVQVSLFYCCCWAWQLGECLSTLKRPIVPLPPIADPPSLCWLLKWQNWEEFGSQ